MNDLIWNDFDPASNTAAVEAHVTLAIGGTATGTIDSADDYNDYAIDVVRGHSYFVVVQGSGDTPLLDPIVYVDGRFPGEFPGEEDSARGDDDGGIDLGSALTFSPLDTGVYNIQVQGSRGDTGGYTIDLIERAPDSVPDTVQSTVPVNIDDLTLGWLNGRSDIDVYTVDMVAGGYYAFQAAGGADDYSESGGVYWSETDTALTLYDPEGRQVAYNDDIDNSEDQSAAIDFLATTGGTYHIAVSVGDRLGSGGFALEVKETILADHDPLDAIDRGTRLAANQVTIYLAAAGEVVDGAVSVGWNDYQTSCLLAAVQGWADVADLHFSITDDPAAATFHLANAPEIGNRARFDIGAPGEANAGDGVFAITGSTSSGLEPGSYRFLEMVAAIGEGLGLTHSYDGGGNAEIMAGVRPTPFSFYGDYTAGAYGLNDTLYTAMGSYFDANTAGPMALDIAAIQRKYGAAAQAAGNTVYTLTDVGSLYRAIWDSGGHDAIVYDGAAAAQIDLTAATADYSATGGGVISSVKGSGGGYTIAPGVVIENARGGSGNDVLTGNAAGNALDGGGGADTMAGGGGDDRYTVDNAGDVIREIADGGYDRVESSVSFAIGWQSIEALQLTGTAAIDGTGGAGNEQITGNVAANHLLGGNGNDILRGNDGNDTLVGGNGADALFGGAGDDLLVVNSASDRVFEAAGEGRDTVESAVSFAIRDQSIEVLRLTGRAAINGAGNADANVIYGNLAANRLTGGGGNDLLLGGRGDDSLHGGTGHDVLTGGAGADRFVFDTAPGAGNWDRIRDFSAAGGDRIVLDHKVFAALPAGTLAGGGFAIGTAATDADDRILYAAATGKLYYDADGSGALAPILFAQVAPGTALDAAAFQVV